MTWNHRVVRRIHPNTHMDDSIIYAIYECYYDENGKLNGITETPIKIVEESIDDLRATVDRIKKCLDNPVVDYDTLEEIKEVN